jgi:ABC-2 type transport system permease protein
MVPGVAAIILLIITTIITAMGIAREREMGTIEQLLITPLPPSVLLLGKILPFALIGLVVTGVELAVGTHLFAIPLRGSLLMVALGTVLYLLTTLGMGIFISTVAKTQQQAILGGFFFLLPAILLSGFMSPIECMPGWIQPLTWINPVRYYVTILRACLLKGAGWSDLLHPLAALLCFGTAILALATLRFRRQLS